MSSLRPSFPNVADTTGSGCSHPFLSTSELPTSIFSTDGVPLQGNTLTETNSGRFYPQSLHRDAHHSLQRTGSHAIVGGYHPNGAIERADPTFRGEGENLITERTDCLNMLKAHTP